MSVGYKHVWLSQMVASGDDINMVCQVLNGNLKEQPKDPDAAEAEKEEEGAAEREGEFCSSYMYVTISHSQWHAVCL